jgi:RNA polymerase sigma-70 factor (ECF subfamily)
MSPEPASATPPFAEIFRDHAPRVWRALRRLGIAEADVPDLCQDVFVVVHRKLPEFEGRSTLATWIYGIAVRVAADHRRRAHVRRERAVAEVPEERRSAPQFESLARERARVMLDAALDTLDDDKRAVFVLYEIEQLAMPEIAEALDCPLQTAYSRLYSARKHVRAEIEARVGGEAL